METLSEILRAARRKARYTQAQLAGFSTVSVRAIRDIELGKVQQPRRETVDLLAGALGLRGSRRAAFELAAGGGSTTETMMQAYDLNQTLPPPSFGTFVGRQPELHALTELLGVEHERLVVVVGTAGVGKTRLALEAAHLLHSRHHLPVLWVHLGCGSNPAASQVLPAGWIHEIITTGGRYDEFAQIIGDKQTLLVLDGIETPPARAAFIPLLRACPGLSIVITTREPGPELAGRVLPLAPLAMPGDGTDRQPALDLMLSYLRHLRPDIAHTPSVTDTMARVCRALDGLPLALESAASWLPLHEPHQLLAIAESFPLMLTESIEPAEPGATGGFQQSLQRSLDRLAPQQTALLHILVSDDTSWTVPAVAERAGCTPAEALRGLHALLLRGLIRTDSGHGARTDLTALRLVRRLVAPAMAAPLLTSTP